MGDRAIATENGTKDNSVGVAEVRVNDSEKLIGMMEDISRRLKKLETSGHQKQLYNNKQHTTRRRDRTTENIFFFPNANARPFTSRMAANNDSNENNEQNVVTKSPLARSAAELAANRYRTANGYGRCTDLLL